MNFNQAQYLWRRDRARARAPLTAIQHRRDERVPPFPHPQYAAHPTIAELEAMVAHAQGAYDRAISRQLSASLIKARGATLRQYREELNNRREWMP